MNRLTVINSKNIIDIIIVINLIHKYNKKSGIDRLST